MFILLFTSFFFFYLINHVAYTHWELTEHVPDALLGPGHAAENKTETTAPLIESTGL